ncbi:GEVED domain-containing protein [Dyadobacter sp. 3J3]|uniref:GEVED domain-containing protein n=1 Tax=Dyadobacter sp. 3J3 TaxID=2606600 RepID=UPI00135706F9|nr:GEVED domain-containing protein [Dyadobacter sp. 3J3]
MLNSTENFRKTYIKTLFFPVSHRFQGKTLTRGLANNGVAGLISLPQITLFPIFLQRFWRSLLCLTLLLSATGGSIYAQSYCESAAGDGSDTGDITNVQIGTLNNSSNCNQTGGVGSKLNKYSNYTSVASPALVQLNTVPFSIEIRYCSGLSSRNSTSIWIDYNHNGVFEFPDERAFSSARSDFPIYTVTGSIIIPESALKGSTRMRVITSGNANENACGNYSDGETEDYTVNIVVPVLCSGMPEAGNTIASENTACLNKNVILSLSSTAILTVNSSGYTYQWFNNAGAIVGATNPTYTATITNADSFYCKVTCTHSRQTGQSTPVAISLTPFQNCYCTPADTQNESIEIFNVTAGTLNNTTNVSQTGGPGSILNSYSDFTTLVAAPVFNQLATIPFSVQVAGTYYSQTSVWIDYNHNSTFESPGERVYQSGGQNFGNYTKNGSFTIPASALTGITRMRVVTSYGEVQLNSACQSYYEGETEDYLVNITAPPACSGSPIPTKTIATQNPVCPQVSFTFSLSPSILTAGNTYQWYNNAGPITGATNETYTTIITNADNFYCKVTCPNGNKTTTSTPVAILEPYIYCPCVSTATASTSEDIFNVTIGELNNSSDCNQTGGPGSSLNRYSDYTTLVEAPDLPVLSAIPYSITTTTCGNYGPNATSIWIDFNHNGLFDAPGERVFSSGYYRVLPSYTESGSFVVPAGSLQGLTRMRVISARQGGLPMNSACGEYSEGETEDYIVNIVAALPPPVCSGFPIQLNTIATQNEVCPQVSFTFSLSISFITSGNTYQWYNDAGLIAGATNETYTATITKADNFYCQVTCSSGNQTATSTPVAIYEPYLYCPCRSASDTRIDQDIVNVTIGELNNTSSCSATGGEGSLPSRYSNYTTQVAAPNFTVSSKIPISVSMDFCGGFGFTATSVWIDYNHNGSFDAPGERVYYDGDNFRETFTLTGSFTIPETAFLGLTRMRVITGDGDVANSACGDYGIGETEDYYVNIVAAACSGTPTAGNTVVSQNNVCANASITLSLSSPPTNTNGITYHWFKDGDATGFIGATYTTSITTTSSFYCEVTCTSSAQQASSTPVTVNVTPVSLPKAATTNTQNVATTPLVANDCQYIAKVVPTSGFTEATVKSWIETIPPFNYVPRHFEITPSTSPNTATGTVTLYFSQADFNVYNATITSGLLPTGPADAAKITNFQILKYAGTSPTGLGYSGSPTYIPGTGNSWNTGDYTFIWNEVNSIWEVTFPVSGFSGFLAKSIAQALPVTLISFTGKAIEKVNELNWKTSSEVNFSHFEIQRSLNAKIFEKIGDRAPDASGNYTFLDTNSPGSTAYYRLKMIDRAAVGRDGTYSFSRIIAIENNAEKAMVGNFYPNPSTGKVYIEITATEKGIWNITTYDLSGRVISFKSKLLQIGLNKILIDKLNHGLNLIKFENGIISETRKVIKE